MLSPKKGYVDVSVNAPPLDASESRELTLTAKDTSECPTRKLRDVLFYPTVNPVTSILYCKLRTPFYT